AAIAPTSTRPRSAGRWPCSAIRAIFVRGGSMRQSGSTALPAAFAANRAVGTVELRVHNRDGLTRRHLVREAGSLRVRFPSPETDALSAVLINSAGGIAEGDAFKVAVEAGSDAKLVVTTAAAEKVYRSQGP